MTKPYFVANWKMNGLLIESLQLVKGIKKLAHKSTSKSHVIICPPFTLLKEISELLPGSGMKLGAQDCHSETHGAYTGEISATMLQDITCDYVIVGHSERRTHYNETNTTISKKAEAAHKAKLCSILCIGETAEERDNGNTKAILEKQLLESIPKTATDKNTIIAYEPVWAIGSGTTPSQKMIQDAHTHITQVIHTKLKQFDSVPPILYGGSVNALNANDILSIDNVQGLLVGRASLDIEEFSEIIQSTS